MVGVEDGLDFVVAGGERGERGGIGGAVGIQLNGGAGHKVVHFLGGYRSLAGVELLDVDFFVAGALLEEEEQAPADGAGSGVGELYAKEYVRRRWSLGAAEDGYGREDGSR